LVFDYFGLLWSIKFPPFGIKHRKGRHIKSYRKQIKTCPLKRITPHVEKYSPPIKEKDILPLSLALHLGKAHEYTRGNKTWLK
jgi:hypothetical protein